VDILEKDWPTLPCREGVLVVGYRNPLVRRKVFFSQ
jgi:hypothetical protein